MPSEGGALFVHLFVEHDKGTVFVEIQGRERNVIATLDRNNPRAVIETDQMKRYRVATRFVLADGECMLFWNKEETL